MKETMLQPLRQKAGLGNPPMPYTNNANESANAKIKEKMDYKKSELNVFCNKMKELIERQRQDVEHAFTLNTGPYEVASEYQLHQENAAQWVKCSTQYKQRAINRIHKLPLVPDPGTQSNADCQDVLESVPSSSSSSTSGTRSLSISCMDAGMPGEIYKGMWKKASQLVGEDNAITDAPKLANSKMVCSYNNLRKPHLVTFFKNGKLTCDCINYGTKHICAHTLATAEKLGLLYKFIEWYKKTNQSPNLWNLVKASGVPKSPGSKPCRKHSRKTLPKIKSSSSMSTKSPSPSPLSKCTEPKSMQQLQTCDVNTQDTIASSDVDTISNSASPTVPVPFQYPYPYAPYCHPYYPPVPMPPYVQQPTQYGYSHGFASPYASSGSGTSSNYSTNSSLQTIYEPSTMHPFTLKFITPRITKCQGCKSSFRSPPSNSLQPPHDLIVARLECHPFVGSDGSVKVSSTAKNSLPSKGRLPHQSRSYFFTTVFSANTRNLAEIHKAYLLNYIGFTV